MSDGNGLTTRLEEIDISQSFRARSPELSARQGEVSLKDVLRNNGEEHFYDEIIKLAVHADEYPPLIFEWKFVHEFVQAIHEANNQAANGGAAVPRSPFPIPDPLTQESFKEALLNYARMGRADHLGTTCLPCSASEFGCAIGILGDLNHDEWTRHIIEVGGAENVLPVANLYVPKAGTNMLEPSIDPRPDGLWNVR